MLISAEKNYAYSPVLLTYYVSKKIERKDLFLADESFYKAYGVDLLLENRVLKIDPGNQVLYLENGKALEYDDLLIATGSSPKALGLEGENLEGIFLLP